MFDPELTFENGLQELGWFPKKKKYSFDRDHPLAKAAEKLVTAWKGGDYEEADQWRPHFEQSWEGAGLSKQVGVSFLRDIIREMLFNALGHGSDWGRKGPVQLGIAKSRFNERLFIWTEDPGEGFDFRSKITNLERTLTSGNGLLKMELGNVNRFWFENVKEKQRQKFRSLLLTSRSAIEE